MALEKLIPVITIDGPVGSGKGTISQRIAQLLHWHFLDSGSLYRLLALAADWHKVALHDEGALSALAQNLAVKFVGDDVNSCIFLEDREVTDSIRTETIAQAASTVAAFPAVRAALLARQRAFKATPGLVADGRDMGTVVFPEAKLKIFLTASAEERALRRYKQLKAKSLNVSLADLVEEIRARDERDKTRAVAPLKPATDALVVDSTHLTIIQVVETIMAEVKTRHLFN